MSKGNKPSNPTFEFEQKAKAQGFSLVIGVDEAGRGPLAGPVVASAVAIHQPAFCNRIQDSKILSPQKREEAFHEIMDNAYIGIGIISEAAIDEMNILQATFAAMDNAVSQLVRRVKEQEKKICLFVDGNRFKSDLPYQYKAIVNGDAQVFSIACASIVAKVTRDRILTNYDRIFPQYGFARHKGYPTKAHKQAIKKHGLSQIHRRTFNY